MSKRELMEAAEQVESPALLRDAYSTLTAKGVLLEDDWGVVSINRQRAKQVMEQDWLYDPLYSEE